MKRLLLIVLTLATISGFAQQWEGSSNLSGTIHRNGNIKANDLAFGKYSATLAGSTEPFNIYSPGSAGNQDLIFFGSGTSATLNIRLFDGSLKFGQDDTPNALINNNGSGILGSTLVPQGTPSLAINYTQGGYSINPEDNKPFVIRRTARDEESLSTYIQDATAHFTYKNDEHTSRIQFRMINSDTESGDGADASDNLVMTLVSSKSGGRVGIGTNTPDAQLAVNGTIHSKEVTVDLNNWPDYVFTSTYQLPNLEELEIYINENQHLPGMPSAQEVQEDGVKLGEMNTKLLEKIEELTLHLIDQNNQITGQNKKLEQQKETNQQLEQRIIQLEKQLQTLINKE